MAIYHYCKNCRNISSLHEKKCRHCGNPFPRENRKYRIFVCVGRKRVTRIVDNITIAREMEAAIKADLLREAYNIKRNKKVPTLGEVWEKYLPWAKENKKSWRDDYYYYRKHIKPSFHNKPIDRITPFDLEKLKVEMSRETNQRGRPYANATIKHQLVIIRRLYNIAQKWGLYDGPNPVNRVEMPRLDNQKTEFMTNEQVISLLKVLDEWPCRESAALVKSALYTGLRQGEIFKLKWEDVDLKRGLITLRDPKGGKSTTIPISDAAINVLKSLEKKSEFVFPGKDGKQRKHFKGPWHRIREAAGLPRDFRFHGLRHHFASTLVSNGIDLAIVKELLTHKDIATTQRYAHLKPDAVHDAAKRSASLLTPEKEDVLISKRG